ncbi:Uncharacterised protein [Mannheimia haemolytica]|uniref:Uncharacterized protein n=1 Tax=Mannheimia haemolytica TaxID=75985 RepID=A0A378NDR8_MANHA|nr:Uncharacterised protein [Mannheimia haemolytica]
MKEDKRAIVRASGKAREACQYMLDALNVAQLADKYDVLKKLLNKFAERHISRETYPFGHSVSLFFIKWRKAMTKSTEIPRGHDNWVITGRDNDGNGIKNVFFIILAVKPSNSFVENTTA